MRAAHSQHPRHTPATRTHTRAAHSQHPQHSTRPRNALRARRAEEAAAAQRAANTAATIAARREAKRASLPPPPAPGTPGAVHVRVRLPDGSNAQRAFEPSCPLGAVFDFVDSLESTNYLAYTLVRACVRTQVAWPVHVGACVCLFECTMPAGVCTRTHTLCAHTQVCNFPRKVYKREECAGTALAATELGTQVALFVQPEDT